MRRLLLGIAIVVVAARARGAERPHVYLVIVDGLDPHFVSSAATPHLVAEGAPESAAVWRAEARAVMPTRTNPNHVTLLTATYADAHGITGNAYWSRRPGAPVEKLDRPALIEVKTFFTMARAAEPPLVTLAAFAKPKLGRLFGAASGRQQAPDHLWSAERAASAERDAATGYTTDAVTMRALLELAARVEPDLAVVNLADVDRQAHERGPRCEDCAGLATDADREIGRLLGELHALGRWDRSVVIVTADHGFAEVAPTPERPQPAVGFSATLNQAGVGGMVVAGDGGVAHVYAEAVAADATGFGEAGPALARVAALARRTEGVSEVLSRLPLEGVPGLAATHPDWHLAHERVGDLLLVAASGYELVDPWDSIDAGLRGNHGGPGEMPVPLIVFGGWRGLRSPARSVPPPSLADVGATIAALLGLPPPRRADGSPVPPALCGRPIAGLFTGRTAGSTR